MGERHSIRRGGRFAKRASADAGAGETASGTGAEATGSAGEPAGAADASAGAAPGRVESVAAGTVPVDVDRAAIGAELEALALDAGEPGATAAGADAVPPAIPPDQQAQALAPQVSFAVLTLAGTFAPNWEVSKGEADQVGAALSGVLAHWFPNAGAIDPKYVALFSLGMSLWAVAGSRRDPETGEWKPLRKPQPDRAPAASSPAAVAPGASAPAPLRL